MATKVSVARWSLVAAAVVTMAAGGLAVAGHAAGPNETVSGDVVVEPPTLISLGFEWGITGDANRNAAVAIAYRPQGTEAWKEGLPLHRMNGEYIGTRVTVIPWTAPNLFAGSLFDLEPDTGYEVRLTLSDPDGVMGETVKTVTARTRPEPMPATDGRVLHVYPWGHTGPKQEPSFQGLKHAYFGGGVADMYNSFPVQVRPGDVILMHAGVYGDSNQYQYSGNRCCGNTFDGTYYLTGKGTAERPIVIKAAGDGEVVFDGYNNNVLFDVTGSAYNYFEGITFRNTEIAILGGRKDIVGTTGLTVKRSKFENVGIGVTTDWQGSQNFYIADNELIGKHREIDKGLFHHWETIPARSVYAVKVYGSGHVVAYNRVRWFHDGIDHHPFGPPDPAYPLPVSNDFYNNDIANLHDDCIETDGSAFNMRVMRNRCVNVNDGISSQPTHGGPIYLIRNVVYVPPTGQYGAFKTFDSQGWTILNNTFATQVTLIGGHDMNSHLRNNLFLAQDPRVPAFAMNTATRYSTSDYNGFMAGPKAPYLFDFAWPPAGTEVVYESFSPLNPSVRPYTLKKLQLIQAKTLEEFRQATGREMHSILVDWSVFQNLQPGDQNAPTECRDTRTCAAQPMVDPDTIDFRLNPTGRAVDAGVVLPNITDGFTGKAPDLGAYESGQPIPHYGPRKAGG